MSIFPISTDLVTWKRSTAYVLEPVAVAASHASDREPSRAATVQVRLQGSPTGTVTVAGNVDGSPDTEILIWTGAAGYRVTRKLFTGALTFTLAQAGGTTIEAKAMGPGGSPVTSLYTVKGPNHPVSIELLTAGRGPARRAGAQGEGLDRILVQFEEVWTPRMGDVVIDDYTSEAYEVVKVGRPKMGGLFISHWIATVRNLDDKANT